MKPFFKKLIFTVTVMLTLFSIGARTWADDDHDGKHDDDEKYEQNYESEDDEDEGYRQYEQQSVTSLEQQTDYWNIWSREARTNSNNPLPISVPGELNAIAGSTEASLYFIPQEGQLLVSAKAIAGILSANVQYFPQSKICILSKDSHELIVRAGFNAAFENRVKTPMPTAAKAYEKTVYLPISTAANALGFRISWDADKKMIQFIGM